MGEWITQWRVEFLGREWNFVDIGSVVVVFSLHCLTLLAPFHFNWPAFWVAVALYFVVGVSVNLSYHRQLSHRSFKLPKWLEYFFAYCGVLSFQYDARLKNVGDLKRDPFYRFLHYTYPLHAISFGVLLYAVGGLPFLVWGLGVRSVWNTGDLSRNNWLIGLMAHGEGWHNNHHAFEYSARHGLEWWEIDVTWYVIRFLEIIGLATEVKLPTETQKKRKALFISNNLNNQISELEEKLETEINNGKI
nr:palmitoyl-monogalactosyldiacylglycerol delta-7 desaturase, chloroplastic-like isoform X2 [Malus domestica]